MWILSSVLISARNQYSMWSTIVTDFGVILAGYIKLMSYQEIAANFKGPSSPLPWHYFLHLFFSKILSLVSFPLFYFELLKPSFSFLSFVQFNCESFMAIYLFFVYSLLTSLYRCIIFYFLSFPDIFIIPVLFLNSFWFSRHSSSSVTIYQPLCVFYLFKLPEAHSQSYLLIYHSNFVYYSTLKCRLYIFISQVRK